MDYEKWLEEWLESEYTEHEDTIWEDVESLCYHIIESGVFLFDKTTQSIIKDLFSTVTGRSVNSGEEYAISQITETVRDDYEVFIDGIIKETMGFLEDEEFDVCWIPGDYVKGGERIAAYNLCRKVEVGRDTMQMCESAENLVSLMTNRSDYDSDICLTIVEIAHSQYNKFVDTLMWDIIDLFRDELPVNSRGEYEFGKILR